ncbi:MAG TPA: hypothetical protein EYH44_04285 [Thermoprotei archaeon]|nr:hypothetical protein [Thermoprotei archaeon]
MKAAVYTAKNDPPHLEVVELPYPEPRPGEVTVKLLYVGVNPIDYWIAGGRYPIASPNRIVGSEGYGVIDSVGEDVEDLSVGDYVTIYPWLFCGSCRYCVNGLENLCINVGIVGGAVDGCYAEYIRLPAKNVVPVESGVGEYLAVAGVSALTAYHAVAIGDVSKGDNVLVYGASGNVGMFILQYARFRDANVYGVSRWSWITEYGALERIHHEELEKYVADRRLEFDVIFNSLGGDLFSESIRYLSRRGRIVTFGGLKNMSTELDIAPIYRLELRIYGSTGGTYKEFLEVVDHLSSGTVKPRIWRVYPLDMADEAIKNLFHPERSGKILIKI